MTRLNVPDMNCGHCKASVLSALSTVPDAGQVEVDLTARTVTVSGPAPAARLIGALDAVGFPATVIAAS